MNNSERSGAPGMSPWEKAWSTIMVGIVALALVLLNLVHQCSR